MKIKVSILIPCYNSERWIAKAIQSALDQTHSNKEVIVLDDGSTDRSLEIIKKFKDHILWETQANVGGNVARNRLLELSTGMWVQYLDADDYLLPDKVAQQLEFLSKIPSVDVIYSPSVIETWKRECITREVLYIPSPRDLWVLLARWYLPQTNSPLWRKQAILDVGGWKTDQPCCQEHELYLRLLKARKNFAYCDSANSIYRHWSNTTVCRKNMPQTWRTRLSIESDIEQYLLETSQMTTERQWAINQARFETARMVFLKDKKWACEIIKQIQKSDPGFVPSGAAAPKYYRFLYRLMGFRFSETLAAMKRYLSQAVSA